MDETESPTASRKPQKLLGPLAKESKRLQLLGYKPPAVDVKLGTPLTADLKTGKISLLKRPRQWTRDDGHDEASSADLAIGLAKGGAR